MELWMNMADLYDQWMEAKIESMIYDYDWSHDEYSAENILAKLENEIGEEGLIDYYNQFHWLRDERPFNDYFIQMAQSLMENS